MAATGLPKVTIVFENGALGLVSPSADGVLGVLCNGVVVAGKFALATPYIITKFADLEANLGITSANNANIVKFFSDFYAMAPDGTEVWLMAFADTFTMANMVDNTSITNGRALLQAANGRLRGLIVTRTPATGYTPTVTAGLDSDVAAALTNAQVLAEYAANTLMAPVFVMLEGRSYSGVDTALTDQSQATKNRVGIFIGDTVASSANACMGLLAGRIASIPVQRNIGRVKDGSIATMTAYIHSKKVEQAEPALIHDKGYITMRTFVGRSGYFFSDDHLCTLSTDDYHTLTARRTIDKAFRIAYDTLLGELLDEIPVNDDGTIAVTKAKSIETKVENAIINSMTINGELGNDPGNQNDTGVSCFIDHTQNLVSTNQLDVTLKVKPFGYAKYIDVKLGFKTLTT
ncbi:MAG: DUF2586 family protein [Bacteroidetes bacterium]|nr:DUF2586 family protein [Bacteroidota bacterium]